MKDVREDLIETAKNGSGMTALMWAACRGHASCVDILLPEGDSAARDVLGKTALMHAERQGSEACASLPTPASDILAKDNKGLSASVHARLNVHADLAQLIEAYALALGEVAAIHSSSSLEAARKNRSLRV